MVFIYGIHSIGEVAACDPMKSWTVWSAVLTMNCRLRYQNLGRGLECATVQCYSTDEPLSLLIGAQQGFLLCEFKI